MTAADETWRGVVRAHDDVVSFWCAGCQCSHHVNVDRVLLPRWDWNGSYTQPTFTPSILVTYEYGTPPVKDICHSFVRDGAIQYLPDSTHALAGTTVKLAWPTQRYVPRKPHDR